MRRIFYTRARRLVSTFIAGLLVLSFLSSNQACMPRQLLDRS